jgi:subtilisin family serine protease
VPASALADLSNDPDVEYISPDTPVAATLNYANPAVNGGITGSTARTDAASTVAVIDSVIVGTHPDLTKNAGGKSRVVYAENLNISAGSNVNDGYGRGTHVAGILAGNASMSAGSGYTHSFWGIARRNVGQPEGAGQPGRRHR